MRFDQETIREIHARVDIASFIGQYVSLKKRGNDLVGLCPFHGEKTPSFHVHPDKGFFKCFGCGVGGDVITFVQKLENATFADAVQMLASKAGIEVEAERPGAARARTEREAIYEANRLAANFFARALNSPAGAAALGYCERRGFSAATIERFALGFAPDSWDALVGELQRNGVDLALAAKAGLVKSGQRGYYDFYRDRLMIPTHATTGEVIAFGGRLLGDGEPKYLNTSTTPVYTKGRHLYALNLARRAAQAGRTLIVVEGYLDCIALHQAGFENAVASLGTSFTPEQAIELRKYADYVYLCFDGDAAGNAAATKAVDIASKSIEHAGSTVRVVMLPGGEDPDSFLRAHGAPAFSKLLDAAKLAIEYKIDAEVDRLRSGFDSPAKIVPRAEALVRELAPRAEWDRWRVYVAQRLQVNVDDLRNSRFFANTANFAPRTGGQLAASRHVAAPVEPLSFERAVVGILLEEPALALEFGDQIPPARFGNALYRKIYERVLGAAGSLRETADVIGLFAGDQESLDVLAGLARRDRSSAVLYESTQERREPLGRVVERLQTEDAKRRYRELSEYLDQRHTAGEPISEDVRAEYRALATKLHG
ncbi:MAG TPA: DNA primase [Candidatus Acidoferrales bacterium]|nr:DNA primase [Candidatus Acidoferrales bacterium]